MSSSTEFVIDTKARLHKIFPQHEKTFDGLKLLLCEDFFQLLPVPSVALYAQRPKTVDMGPNSISSFRRTLRLTQLMGQQGEDPITVQALTNMRVNTLQQ